MIIKSILADIGIIVCATGLGATAGGIHGYKLGVAHDAGKVTQAQHATAVANANAQTLAATLATTQQKLATQMRTLTALQQAQQAALATRARTQADLAKTDRAREAQDWRIAHATPNHAELARLPVYPGLARRLFDDAGLPPGSTAGDAQGH